MTIDSVKATYILFACVLLASTNASSKCVEICDASGCKFDCSSEAPVIPPPPVIFTGPIPSSITFPNSPSNILASPDGTREKPTVKNEQVSKSVANYKSRCSGSSSTGGGTGFGKRWFRCNVWTLEKPNKGDSCYCKMAGLHKIGKVKKVRNSR